MAFFSRKILPIIKDGVYVINLHDKNNEGTHWFSLLFDRNTVVYFYSFGTEHIPKKY